MSVSQISIGMTAAKSSSGGDTTIAALEKKSAGARENAKRLQARADELRATGKTANIRLAASEEKAAIKQTAIADEAETDAQKRRGNSTGTPIMEIVGKTGLIALSIALSVALSLSGIVLMHVAGSLWRRASGALPVDQQILELLHKIHGGPAAPAEAAEIVALAPAPALPEPVDPAQAPASFKPAGIYAPKDATSGFSYTGKTMLAGAGALAAIAAPMAQAAPAVSAAAPVNVDIPSPINDDIPASMKTGVSAPVNADVLTSPEPVIVDIPDAPQKARKPRVVRDGAVMDTGTGEHDGFRYRRAVAGVKAGKIRPSISGLYAGVEVTAPTARRFLAAMLDAGVIVKKGRGYVLAEKYQALLAKKGGAK